MQWSIKLLMLLSLSGVAFQEVEKPPEEPWANKLFGGPDARNHAFGAVCKGSQPRYEFQVTNIYQVPIEITKISYQSGTMEVATDKKVLQPNEKAVIVVTLKPEKFIGPKTGAIWVDFGPWVSTATLTWSATSQ
jgi:hypothetical protein